MAQKIITLIALTLTLISCETQNSVQPQENFRMDSVRSIGFAFDSIEFAQVFYENDSMSIVPVVQYGINREPIPKLTVSDSLQELLSDSLFSSKVLAIAHPRKAMIKANSELQFCGMSNCFIFVKDEKMIFGVRSNFEQIFSVYAPKIIGTEINSFDYQNGYCFDMTLLDTLQQQSILEVYEKFLFGLR